MMTYSLRSSLILGAVALATIAVVNRIPEVRRMVVGV